MYYIYHEVIRWEVSITITMERNDRRKRSFREEINYIQLNKVLFMIIILMNSYLPGKYNNQSLQ